MQHFHWSQPYLRDTSSRYLLFVNFFFGFFPLSSLLVFDYNEKLLSAFPLQQTMKIAFYRWSSLYYHFHSNIRRPDIHSIKRPNEKRSFICVLSRPYKTTTCKVWSLVVAPQWCRDVVGLSCIVSTFQAFIIEPVFLSIF